MFLRLVVVRQFPFRNKPAFLTTTRRVGHPAYNLTVSRVPHPKSRHCEMTASYNFSGPVRNPGEQRESRRSTEFGRTHPSKENSVDNSGRLDSAQPLVQTVMVVDKFLMVHSR